MFAVARLFVCALVVSFGMTSGAHALAPKGALRAMTSSAESASGAVVCKSAECVGETASCSWRGRRVSPLHEWVEGQLAPLADAGGVAWITDDPAIKKREAELEAHLAQGPPERGSKSEPITWLFEPESFAPMARLQGGDQQAIVCDHLGTPVLMVDGARAEGWSGTLGVYGELRSWSGDSRWGMPFRFPGMYEDAETGLSYNRFRYYDAEAGQYTSQDPIGLAGGSALYGYVQDPLAWTDPLGLSGCRNAQQELRAVGALEGRSADEVASILKKRGFRPTEARSGGTVWTKEMPKGQTAVVRIDPAEIRVPPRGYADEVAHAHKETVPTSVVSNRGNFPHRRATTLDDSGRKTSDPARTHIPMGL